MLAQLLATPLLINLFVATPFPNDVLLFLL